MKQHKILPYLLIVITSIASMNCGGDDPFLREDDFTTVPDPFSIEGITPDTSETGLIVYTLEEGTGPFTVQLRDNILIYYTGRTTDQEIFDSSYKNGSTTPASQSVTSVIEGYREGVIGMKEGGKKVLVIPPSLAYGDAEGHRLQNDTLVFDIELETIVSQ